MSHIGQSTILDPKRRQFVNETAEFIIIKWITTILPETAQLFTNGMDHTRPFYIQQNMQNGYSIEYKGPYFKIYPDIVDYNYIVDVSMINDNDMAKQAIGVIGYCINTVYTAIIQLLKDMDQKNMLLVDKDDDIFNLSICKLLSCLTISYDENKHMFYFKYFDELDSKKAIVERKINQLLNQKQSGKATGNWSEEWKISQDALETIEQSSGLDVAVQVRERWEEILSKLPRIGIKIDITDQMS